MIPTALLFILFLLTGGAAIIGYRQKLNPIAVLACAFFAGYNLAFFIVRMHT